MLYFVDHWTNARRFGGKMPTIDVLAIGGCDNNKKVVRPCSTQPKYLGSQEDATNAEYEQQFNEDK